MALHGGRGACCSLNRPERGGGRRIGAARPPVVRMQTPHPTLTWFPPSFYHPISMGFPTAFLSDYTSTRTALGLLLPCCCPIILKPF